MTDTKKTKKTTKIAKPAKTKAAKPKTAKPKAVKAEKLQEPIERKVLVLNELDRHVLYAIGSDELLKISVTWNGIFHNITNAFLNSMKPEQQLEERDQAWHNVPNFTDRGGIFIDNENKYYIARMTPFQLGDDRELEVKVMPDQVITLDEADQSLFFSVECLELLSLTAGFDSLKWRITNQVLSIRGAGPFLGYRNEVLERISSLMDKGLLLKDHKKTYSIARGVPFQFARRPGEAPDLKVVE